MCFSPKTPKPDPSIAEARRKAELEEKRLADAREAERRARGLGLRGRASLIEGEGGGRGFL